MPQNAQKMVFFLANFPKNFLLWKLFLKKEKKLMFLVKSLIICSFLKKITENYELNLDNQLKTWKNTLFYGVKVDRICYIC